MLIAGAVGLLLVGAGTLAVRAAFFVVTVIGESMAPTYRWGDRVLVRRSPRYQRGAVVVFHSPVPDDGDRRVVKPHLMLKRVVAVPGDPVPPDVVAAVATLAGERVPPGRLVVIGDGAVSQDSRHWGYLSARAVVGTVVRALPVRTSGTRDPHGGRDASTP